MQRNEERRETNIDRKENRGIEEEKERRIV
jgi:hypothetical protein